MSKKLKNKLYTLAEACELLSISTATGRNWVKSGRLVCASAGSKKPLFEESTLLALKNALADGSISGLKSRRNKTYISGNTSAMDDFSLRCQLRFCAEQLVLSAGYHTVFPLGLLLDDLIDTDHFGAWKSSAPAYCTSNYTYIPGEDTLGALYQSLCHIGNRKSSGSYYTPAWLAKQLVKQHLPMLKPYHTVCDPSCGTGIFLLQLPANLPLQNIYGNDINPLSAALTRINLALKYHIETAKEVELLQRNITVSDFLHATSDHSCSGKAYDIILGNPPWGAKLSAAEKQNYGQRFFCTTGSSIEIYDLFMEQSLRLLAPEGVLSFVLPEAILTVKTHTPVRKLLLQNTYVRSVEYLGEVFDQVHCPSIILTVVKDNSKPFFKNVTIKYPGADIFTTNVERIIYADSFPFALTDEEYLLLQKIQTCPVCTTLVDKSVFALGIVTGNNVELLHTTPAPGMEPIIKGSDISKYHINSVSGYLSFQPEKFQQVAPEEVYRAPEKLFYRFINKKLTFAYDNTGLLSLNSCNIVVPEIPGVSVKYVMAILNSSVAQFVFEKKFRSVKVLRSHLEQIPIPLVDEEKQKEIVKLVDKLIVLGEDTLEFKHIYLHLDHSIADLYGLSREEYKKISA